MQVTPEAVREGKFREALRGYHRDDVDEFLERVAGGIAALQDQLRQATERSLHAEQQATEAAELDDSLRRTLVLAQRTADLAVEEARKEASELVEDARLQRENAMAELAAEHDRLREETQKTVQDEVASLHEARERLTVDIAELGAYYERQREWLRVTLAEQLRVISEGGIDVGPPPAIHDVDPALVAEGALPAVEEGAAEGAPPAVEEGAVEEAAVEADVAEASSPYLNGDADQNGQEAGASFLSELQRVMDAAGTAAAAEDDDVLPPPDERARAFFDEDDEIGARRFGGIRRRRRRT
jgi:cell division initiation protein